jgi:hypothetical protein
MPAAKLTPTQRVALHHVAAQGTPPYPRDVPGGMRTVRALVSRGYVALDHSRVLITNAGRARVAS